MGVIWMYMADSILHTWHRARKEDMWVMKDLTPRFDGLGTIWK
jgi:hypothetical protein